MAALESLSFVSLSDVVKLLNPLNGTHRRSAAWKVGALRLPLLGLLTSSGDNAASYVTFTCFPSAISKVLWSGVQKKQGGLLVCLHL